MKTTSLKNTWEYIAASRVAEYQSRNFGTNNFSLLPHSFLWSSNIVHVGGPSDTTNYMNNETGIFNVPSPPPFSVLYFGTLMCSIVADTNAFTYDVRVGAWQNNLGSALPVSHFSRRANTLLPFDGNPIFFQSTAYVTFAGLYRRVITDATTNIVVTYISSFNGYKILYSL
jgi:hypothetical protein